MYRKTIEKETQKALRKNGRHNAQKGKYIRQTGRCN